MDINGSYRLKNGVEIPRLGLGTWRAESGRARQAVCRALQEGYRLVDTAAYYDNEEEVGAGLRDSGVNRAEIFVTTKVWVEDSGYSDTLRAFEESMKRLGLDYLDMYMVHWPVVGKYKETFRALEELHRQKRIRVIGVSNFSARLLKELDREMEHGPMVDQLQFHPLYFRQAEYDYCMETGIFLQAWKPLARGKLSGEAGVLQMAKVHGKTPEQILLRWALQLGIGVIPKSTDPARLRQNADLFDFALEDPEMAYLRALDKGESLSAVPEGTVLN